MLSKADHNALFLSGTEGHFHPLSDLQLHARRNQIGKGVSNLLMHNIYDDLCQHLLTSLSILRHLLL